MSEAQNEIDVLKVKVDELTAAISQIVSLSARAKALSLSIAESVKKILSLSPTQDEVKQLSDIFIKFAEAQKKLVTVVK